MTDSRRSVRWGGGLAIAALSCAPQPAPSRAAGAATATATATATAYDDVDVGPATARPESFEALGNAMVGVVVPQFEVVLVATGFARLQRLDLEVGDTVGEGEVVAQMDVRGDKSELASATASWRASKARLDRLGLELEAAMASRSDVEQIQNFISKAEIREQRFAEKLAGASKRSAGASLRQQRSKMDEASARIAEAELRAPFRGVVARRYVDPGATLAIGEPVVQIISETQLVRFAVPESRAESLHIGALVEIRFAGDARVVSGEVTTIAPEIDAGTRLIFAEAKLRTSDGDNARLRVGVVGEVWFATP